MSRIWFGIFLFFILLSCKSGSKTMAENGIVVKSGDGWISDETYQITVAGGWSRDRYYIEEEQTKDREDSGKKPKSIFLLRQLSKTAAKTIAIRDFKQTMISELISETEVKDNTIVKDKVVNLLSGISIAPRAIKEVYSPKGDAEITFRFEAENLKENVEKAINETVSRYQEESKK